LLTRRPAGLKGRQQPAGVVEMQVAQDHDIDILVAQRTPGQRAQQHVLVLVHAETGLALRLEERPDSGFEQHRAAVQSLGKQTAASELDAVVFVRREPLRPKLARHVAEHGAAV
jgi:hypothetical protein